MSLRPPEPLAGHDTEGFDCGVEALNGWLRRSARRQRLSATLVAADDGVRVMAFYCLSAASVRSATPGPWVRATAPEPVLKLGRLAVDRTMQGRGLGSALVLDAFARTYAISRHAPVAALVADAPDASAAGWLTGLGFQPVPEEAPALFVPMGTIEALVERHGRK